MSRAGRTLGWLIATLTGIAWLLTVLASWADRGPRGLGLGGSLPSERLGTDSVPETMPERALDLSGEDRARHRPRRRLRIVVWFKHKRRQRRTAKRVFGVSGVLAEGQSLPEWARKRRLHLPRPTRSGLPVLPSGQRPSTMAPALAAAVGAVPSQPLAVALMVELPQPQPLPRLPRLPLRLPRLRVWTRRRALVLAVVVVALALVGGLIAYLVPGSTPGHYGAAKAGTVQQVTGLGFGAGGITPTANPSVPLSWNAATLSNGGAVGGYVVNRYNGSNVLQSTGAACSGTVGGTSCTENSVPDGTWKYGIRAKYYNWLGPESGQITMRVDTSAPTIAAKPQSPSANATPTFSFSHSTYSGFKCRLDGAATFTSCSTPDTLATLSDGSHTFRVEALDANGFATQVATYTWTIDTSAPSITAKPAATSANTAPSFSFTHGSYSSFQCKLDSGPFGVCTTPDALSGLSTGSHTFRVRAVDADGVTTQMASYTWTINTSAPTITAKPASTSGNPSPSFSFTHSAASYTFMCKLDGGSFAVCTSPKALSGLADGSHAFTVEAVDPDGFVVPTTASYTWTINTTAPSITAKPQSPSANKTPSFSFTHTVGTYTFKCKVDAGAFATCTSPNTTASLTDGSHTFTVEAVDADGFAITNTASYTWTVNSAAPSITAKPQSPSANTAPSFSFNHGVYVTFKCQLDGGGFTTCTSPKALSSLGNAAHTFQVEGIDADGVATTVASYTWTVDANAPTIGTKPSNPSANASPSFSFSHTQGSYSFKCQLDAGGFTTCASPKAYTGLADGPHTFQVEGIDADSVATSVASYTWTIDTSAPTITAKPSNPSANASPSFSFSHGSYSSFQCKLDAGSFASCTSPKAYSGLADGSHTFQVQAVAGDASTTTAASYTWTIDTTPPTATITFPATGTTYAAAAFNAGCSPIGLCGTAADATGVQTVKVSIRQGSGNYWNGTSFASASEVFNTTTLASPGGTSTAWNYTFALPADGAYTVHVQTADTLANAQTGTTYAATSTFTVDTTPPTVNASVIAKSAGGTPGFIKQGGSYFVYANVTDTLSSVSTVTANVSSVTTGATSVALTSSGGPFTIGGVTYTYRSAPQNADGALSPGSKSYAITATDSAGNSATNSTFSVTVDNTAPTAVDISANTGNGMVDSGDVITYTFSETIDPNSIKAGWDGTSTPVTVSFNDVGTNDTVTVTGTNLGTIATGGNYQKSTQTASANMVLSGSTITVTLTSSPSNGQENTVASSTMVWTPSASATDRAGNPMSTATATESTGPKKNF